MQIARSELEYDFKDAQFDLGKPEERELLSWVLNQFLYGEVTGIQCGHWLYRAPSLNAAIFLAGQATQELTHVKRVVKMLEILGGRPAKAHPVIRFLSTGMMGKNWGEHVFLEMALGEGLVLSVFYALRNTIPDPKIQKILDSMIPEEESHVAFGERETLDWFAKHPEDRAWFYFKARTQRLALNVLKRWIVKKYKGLGWDRHPVLMQFDAFFGHILTGYDQRLVRLGLTTFYSWRSVLNSRMRMMARKKQKPLTTTYLLDPSLSFDSGYDKDGSGF